MQNGQKVINKQPMGCDSQQAGMQVGRGKYLWGIFGGFG